MNTNSEEMAGSARLTQSLERIATLLERIEARMPTKEERILEMMYAVVMFMSGRSATVSQAVELTRDLLTHYEDVKRT